MSTPDKAIGWRKRIGLLSPTVIETAAYDFYKLAPEGVTMCATTSNIEHWNKDNFKQHVLDPLVTAVKYLASRNVDYIVHTGMPVVTTRGKGFEDEMVKLITDATGLPATTSIRSAIRALTHLGVKNVAILSPYPQELHQSAIAFLKASGFNVVGDHTEDVVFKRLQDVTPATIAAAAKGLVARAPAAEGIYLPCNQWAGADAAPLIEMQLGIPVVSGGHADYWEAFRALGINDRIEGHGRLMASLSAMPRRAVAASA
jgi:maleate cis-trans isomerase